MKRVRGPVVMGWKRLGSRLHLGEGEEIEPFSQKRRNRKFTGVDSPTTPTPNKTCSSWCFCVTCSHFNGLRTQEWYIFRDPREVSETLTPGAGGNKQARAAAEVEYKRTIAGPRDLKKGERIPHLCSL